jgi:hypothetical protein
MTAAELATPTRVGVEKSRFYLWTAVAMLVIAVGGFAPTFWIPLAQGVPERFPLFAVHGVLCYAWIAFLIYQTWLVRSGRMVRHRNMGLLGASLATALVTIGVMATASATRRAVAAGYADGAEAFMILPMGELIFFTGFLAVALRNLQRPEWHKRFMIAATAWLLPAPVARWYVVFVQMGGHMPPLNGTVGLAGLPAAPPLPITLPLPPDLIVPVIIGSAMIFDWRKRGSVHPAWWWAGGGTLAFDVLKGPFSGTALWHHIARGLLAIF